MGVKRKITGERKHRVCLNCRGRFLSQNSANRICGPCKEAREAIDWRGGAASGALDEPKPRRAP